MRKQHTVTTACEVGLDGLMGEINKLIIVLTNGVVLVYNQQTQESKTLGDACSRFGRAERAELLLEVEQEIGYTDEKLKALRRVRAMLTPTEEISNGSR